MRVYDIEEIRKVTLDGGRIKHVDHLIHEQVTNIHVQNKEYLVPDEGALIFNALSGYISSITLVGHIRVKEYRESDWRKTKFTINNNPTRCGCGRNANPHVAVGKDPFDVRPW